MRKVERGDLTVGLGVAFEAAAVLGVPLFSTRSPLAGRSRPVVSTIVLPCCPALVRKPTEVDDDF